jgi:hypothetical protein
MHLYKEGGFDTYDWGGIAENENDGRTKSWTGRLSERRPK